MSQEDVEAVTGRAVCGNMLFTDLTIQLHLSTELEDENIAVVSLYPGIVVTEKMNNLMRNPKEFEEKVSASNEQGVRGDQ